MQLKLWFFAGQAMAKFTPLAGEAGTTAGLPSPVFTPCAIVLVVDSDVDFEVELDVLLVEVLLDVVDLLVEVEVLVDVEEVVDVDAVVTIVVVGTDVVKVVEAVVELVVVGFDVVDDVEAVDEVEVVDLEVVDVLDVVVELVEVVVVWLGSCPIVSFSAWATVSTAIPELFMTFICGWKSLRCVSHVPIVPDATQW